MAGDRGARRHHRAHPVRGLPWAAMAVEIQREVGGNLAEVLQTVADTMLARNRLKGEIRRSPPKAGSRRSCSARCRSPWSVPVDHNRDYLQPLLDETFGSDRHRFRSAAHRRRHLLAPQDHRHRGVAVDPISSPFCWCSSPFAALVRGWASRRCGCRRPPPSGWPCTVGETSRDEALASRSWSAPSPRWCSDWAGGQPLHPDRLPRERPEEAVYAGNPAMSTPPSFVLVKVLLGIAGIIAAWFLRDFGDGMMRCWSLRPAGDGASSARTPGCNGTSTTARTPCSRRCPTRSTCW
jgi:hypothetical protein